jgi:hypothetical protein
MLPPMFVEGGVNVVMTVTVREEGEEENDDDDDEW